MRGQAGFFDLDERLSELSAKGDDLERLNAIIDFDLFRPDLARAVPRADRSKGGRPPFDHVFMFKVLVVQASHSLSDERTEFLIKDRLSFMRFLGLGLSDPVPDANTIWSFREALTRAQIEGRPAIEVLFQRFDAALRRAGFLAMGGQIIDASLVACPKQRNNEAEKAALKQGRIPEGWAENPKRLAQKDRDARWTVKWSKAKPSEDGTARVDIAVPVFGYKNHIGMDREHGLIRTWAVTDAARYDGALLPALLDKPTRLPTCGATRPSAPGRMRSTWPPMACARAFTARSRWAARCRSTWPGRTGASRRCAQRWSTCLPVRRGRWGWLCARSVWPERR